MTYAELKTLTFPRRHLFVLDLKWSSKTYENKQVQLSRQTNPKCQILNCQNKDMKTSVRGVGHECMELVSG